MSEDSSRAAWLRQARSYLRKVDPVLARLIDARPDFDPPGVAGQPFSLRRRWTCTVPCCSRSPASSCPSRRPAGPWPASRRCSAAICPRPAELLGVDPAQLRAGRAVVAEDRHAARPRRAAVGRAAGPDGAEQPARRRAHGRAHRDSGDRPVDRAGRPAPRARPGGRRRAGRPARSARPSRPPTGWTTSPPSRRSSPSPTNGGPTAAWRPATCSPPPSSQSRRHRSPGTGALDDNR